MANPADENFTCDSGVCAELPLVPIRHRKILDKLARCSYCSRLCCCIEHCLMHENKHSEIERDRKRSCTVETHEWIEASESALSSRVVKSEFPFFCVYCKIKVQGENDLRHLMVNGSLCPIKKYHWMVPLTIYHENNEEFKENKENFSGSIDGRSAFHTHQFTPRKPPEKSLLRRALTNCLNQSQRTPPQLNYQETTVTGPLTSTPESDYVSCSSLETDVSPTTPTFPCISNADQITMGRAGILSQSPRSKPRSKGTLTRRVTFACDSEALNDGGQGAENENENAATIKKDGLRNEESIGTDKTGIKEVGGEESVPLQTINRRKENEY